jgi:RNA ligase (TIGR02306 family)
MSEFHIRVVSIGPIVKHPNADALSIVDVEGYPVIMRTGDFAEGDKAVYVPVDAIVPADDPRWAFLAGHWRIKAKKLRGTFSMGLLTASDPAWEVGQNVQAELRIEKYDPEIAEQNSKGPCPDDEPDPGLIPVYTDIEGLRKYSRILETGEQVVLTEKIHGENFRAVFADGRLWVGSRTRFKRPDAGTKWWAAARSAGLEEKLARFPGVAVYGESHGYTGGFPYGQPPGKPAVRLFDALDSKTRRYFHDADFQAFAEEIGVDTAPVLYRGSWSEDLRSHAEGRSTLDASHVREGFVVRPVVERHDHRVGRVILKMVGEGYLLRKGA